MPNIWDDRMKYLEKLFKVRAPIIQWLQEHQEPKVWCLMCFSFLTKQIRAEQKVKHSSLWIWACVIPAVCKKSCDDFNVSWRFKGKLNEIIMKCNSSLILVGKFSCLSAWWPGSPVTQQHNRLIRVQHPASLLPYRDGPAWGSVLASSVIAAL